MMGRWMGAGIGIGGGGGATHAFNAIRNNSMSGAANGSPGTLPTNWNILVPTGLTRTITVGTQASGPYTVNIIDVNYAGTTSSTSAFQVKMETATQVAALTGQAWSESLWFSMPVDHAAITTFDMQIWEMTNVGALVTVGTSGDLYTNRASFARRTFTRTTTGGGTVAFVQPVVITNSVTSGTAINFTLRIGWPQLEPGATISLPKVTP